MHFSLTGSHTTHATSTCQARLFPFPVSHRLAGPGATSCVGILPTYIAVTVLIITGMCFVLWSNDGYLPSPYQLPCLIPSPSHPPSHASPPSRLCLHSDWIVNVLHGHLVTSAGADLGGGAGGHAIGHAIFFKHPKFFFFNRHKMLFLPPGPPLSKILDPPLIGAMHTAWKYFSYTSSICGSLC